MINITKAAAQYIKAEAIKKGKPTVRIRLGIRGGGCTGFSYIIEWDENDPSASDFLFKEATAEVVIDPKSYVYLKGTVLDFEKSLMRHGLKIRNPNEKEACGCGESINF